ncbi:TetR/AcrR family transcriptional regulator [Microbacterium sp. SORGH_AS_0888]|uniref:TetR/AcrR family transcriptional regulator n=1 Tax=Microbacterium sp. SORGH_AS_0888 TaxID=3041791 RepID=UPI002783228D|nr:TetR/AcrR family transcriptional regulator [Microbacterium sp. SORGH_AS_0888]MDQ1131116.1 AcrR family transcriptional regulator [Microbacterium sp. SORGH_AS_0888]
MASARRRRLTPEERRSQLLAIGVAFLGDQSLDDLTIEALSERAGVSRGLVFHYFGSRQGLHRAVVTTAAESMLAFAVPREELPPSGRLRDTLGRVVGFVREYRGTFFSLVRGVASGDPVVRTVVDDARDVHAQRIVSVFVEMGSPDTRLLRVVLRSWVSFAEEILIELALGTETAAESIVDLLVGSAHGVVAAAESASCAQAT